MKNTNCYKDLLGLSCVENNVLMYLSKEGCDISWLYADSEMGLEELFKYFFIYKKEHEYFDGFPQIQNKLKKLSVLSINAGKSFKVLLNELENQKDILYLIKVKPEIFKNNHYMYVEDSGDKLSLKNYSPFFEINIDKSKLNTIYAGQYLKIKKERELTKDDERLFRRQHRRAEIPESWEILYIPGMENSRDIFERLRDLLDIYRISRKRRQIYERASQNMDHMDDGLREIENLIDFVSDMSLKNIVNKGAVIYVLKSIWKIEQKI